MMLMKSFTYPFKWSASPSSRSRELCILWEEELAIRYFQIIIHVYCFRSNCKDEPEGVYTESGQERSFRRIGEEKRKRWAWEDYQTRDHAREWQRELERGGKTICRWSCAIVHCPLGKRRRITASTLCRDLGRTSKFIDADGLLGMLCKRQCCRWILLHFLKSTQTEQSAYRCIARLKRVDWTESAPDKCTMKSEEKVEKTRTKEKQFEHDYVSIKCHSCYCIKNAQFHGIQLNSDM